MQQPSSGDARRHNLELKVRCSSLETAREVVRPIAHASTVEVQTDTFFRAVHGRLKLREIDSQAAVLIWYERADDVVARLSAYHLVPVVDPAGLKIALTAALGVRGVVRKRREIYLWHNVRIHLDEVAGLGNFLEFEAVLNADEDQATARDRLEHLCQLLGVTAADHLAVAYADLLGL
jgi:predicted adenylyl cyclase CyaB